MTLTDFLTAYDHPGSIVLLEGKRDVRPEDVPQLIALGKMLAEQSSHILFRSGNAEGSDLFFSQGVAGVDARRLQVITPYSGHRSKANQAYSTVALDQINLAEEPEVVYHSRQHKKTDKLIDQYLAGERDRFSIKAAYILRDTVKVLGTTDVPRATFAIFYDDLLNPRQGGTGHTMRVCEENEMPMVDQREWMAWVVVE